MKRGYSFLASVSRLVSVSDPDLAAPWLEEGEKSLVKAVFKNGCT